MSAATWRAFGWGGSGVRRECDAHPARYGHPSVSYTIAFLICEADYGRSRAGDTYVAHDGAAYAWAPPRMRALDAVTAAPTDGYCPHLARGCGAVCDVRQPTRCVHCGTRERCPSSRWPECPSCLRGSERRPITADRITARIGERHGLKRAAGG